jgi:hypothetical protein
MPELLSQITCGLSLLSVVLMFVMLMRVRASSQAKDYSSLETALCMVADTLQKADLKSFSTISAEVVRAVEGADKKNAEMVKALAGYQKAVIAGFDGLRKSGDRADGALNGIRDYLSAKNDLTERLQEGYDFKIMKSFSKQIIRCIQSADETTSSDSASALYERVQGLRDDLLDLLDRNGVERFSPSPGTSFSELRKVAEVSTHKEKTSDKSLVGTVASVIRPGYRYSVDEDNERIVMPAQVKLYEGKEQS